MAADSVLEGPPTTYRDAPTVGARFLDWVRSTPAAPALRAHSETVSYGQLYERAAGLASAVTAEAPGGGPVAVDTADPGSAVVALVAARLLARPYVCVGGKQPPARTLDMVRQAGAPVLVCASPQGRALAVEAGIAAVEAREGAAPGAARQTGGRSFTPAPQDGSEAMYVIFTSGSTGRPKGVLVGEPSVRNLLAWAAERFGAAPGWRFSQLADLSFDAHVLDVWFALATGGTVVVPGRSPLGDPAGLRRWLAEEEIDFSFVPTSLMPSLLEHWTPGRQPAYLWAGGEQFKARPAADVETTMINGYGPTETTVIVTAEEVAPGDVAALGFPDLGRPIAGVTLAVVDPGTLAPVPVGERGELLIGGACLSLGYLQDELDERFVSTDLGRPGGQAQRFYRSGDLVSVNTAGSLTYHGRIDRQVQIRGYRVEPEEVEAVLERHDLVREVSVRDTEDGPSRSLVAYVVPAEEGVRVAPLVRTLREDLADVLPDYMVPAYFELLEAFPRTAGGKVDIDRLAPRGSSRIGLASDYVEPGTDVERWLCEAWQEELGIYPVGIADDFFELGGHSLRAVQISQRLAEDHGLHLDVTTFFEHPTIAAMSAALEHPPEARPLAMPEAARP